MYMNLNYDEPMYQKLVKLHKMAVWITLTMPAFPLVYLLAAVGVVNQEQTAIAFVILSVFDKGLYAVILMDLNADSVVFAEAIKSVFNTFRGAAIGKGIQL
eukprot:gene40964-50428_t